VSEENNALSLVPQINAAYNTVMSAEEGSLKDKVKLGELLNLAKGSMKHGQWTDWLAEHCPKISHRSANVYMNLAEHKEVLGKKLQSNSQRAAILGGGAEMSIREAIKETRTPEEQAKIEERVRKAKLAKELAKANSPAGKQLKALDASGVLEILIGTFDADFLSALADSLDEHLAKDLERPPVVKRRKIPGDLPLNHLQP
jgi:hypothetical protein